jgi:hypothetical protein
VVFGNTNLTPSGAYCKLRYFTFSNKNYRGVARMTKGFVQSEVETATELIEQARSLQNI